MALCKQRCTCVTVVEEAQKRKKHGGPMATDCTKSFTDCRWPCHGQHTEMVVNGESNWKRMQLPACRP
jgi:hypothetical protein